MRREINTINYFKGEVCLSYTCIKKKNDILIQTNNIFNQINFNKTDLAIPVQRHTDNVIWTDRGGTYKNCDGLASNLSYNVTLSLSVADCVPVCMFDPETQNFALIHSGWEGTHKNISKNGVKLLIENGSKAKDIMVYCGVSISQKNYEVGAEVASLFLDKNLVSNGNKFLLDIKTQIEDDLISTGLKAENIFSVGECTYEDRGFPSYRRDGDRAGRITFFMGKYIGRN
jgi:YfiH family protein